MYCTHGVRRDKDCRYCATGTEPAQPSAESAGSPLDVLRREQAEAVMPLIGGLLDAWDGLATDLADEVIQESPSLGEYMLMIRQAMER